MTLPPMYVYMYMGVKESHTRTYVGMYMYICMCEEVGRGRKSSYIIIHTKKRFLSQAHIRIHVYIYTCIYNYVGMCGRGEGEGGSYKSIIKYNILNYCTCTCMYIIHASTGTVYVMCHPTTNLLLLKKNSVHFCEL